jgi:isoleucyl-tRNA synthetase
MVLLDAFAYPELAQEGLAREVLNRIQRLRKRAGLVPTDDVQVSYRVLGPATTGTEESDAAGDSANASAAANAGGDAGANAEATRLENERVLEEMFEQQKATFAKAASHGVVSEVKAAPSTTAAVAEEETEVKDIRLVLRLLKL